MKTILVTAFDPFGGESINPAWECCKRLPDNIAGYTIEKLQIPTVFDKAGQKVIEKIGEINPEYVIMLGQAGGRKNVTPEKVAINYADASIKDNEGNEPKATKIVDDGPDGIFTNINIESAIETMKTEGFNVAISLSAGAFVCNDTFYMVAYYLQGSNIKYGFVHVPYIPSQTKDAPSLELDEIVKTITRYIELITRK